MIKNQKGFTAFEIVLVIVTLLAVGAAGYFAYQARQDKTDYSVNIPHKKTPSSSESSKVKYLVIKEWNVKLKLPEEYNDLYYVIKSENPQAAYMSTRSLDKIAPQCTAVETSQVAIGRYKNSEELPGAQSVIRTIGNYKFTAEYGNGSCLDSNEGAAYDKVMKLRRDFNSIAGTLTSN